MTLGCLSRGQVGLSGAGVGAVGLRPPLPPDGAALAAASRDPQQTWGGEGQGGASRGERCECLSDGGGTAGSGGSEPGG